MQVLIESTKFPSKALHDAGAMYSTQGQISGFDLCVLKDRGPMGAVDKKEVPPLIIIFFLIFLVAQTRINITILQYFSMQCV